MGALSQVPTEPPRKSDTLLMNMGVSGLPGPGWALASALDEGSSHQCATAAATL